MSTYTKMIVRERTPHHYEFLEGEELFHRRMDTCGWATVVNVDTGTEHDVYRDSLGLRVTQAGTAAVAVEVYQGLVDRLCPPRPFASKRGGGRKNTPRARHDA